MAMLHQRDPLGVSTNERDALMRLEKVLDAADPHDPPCLNVSGTTVELPASILPLLRQTVHCLARGQAVTLIPVDKLLTTSEAAEILNVSRPYLVKLLNESAIPYTMTGSHHRVRFDDLMAYKKQRDAGRREALREITRIGEELDALMDD